MVFDSWLGSAFVLSVADLLAGGVDFLLASRCLLPIRSANLKLALPSMCHAGWFMITIPPSYDVMHVFYALISRYSVMRYTNIMLLTLQADPSLVEVIDTGRVV